MGFPGGSIVKKKYLLAKAGDTGDLRSIPGARKIPLEEEMPTHSDILA